MGFRPLTRDELISARCRAAAHIRSAATPQGEAKTGIPILETWGDASISICWFPLLAMGSFDLRSESTHGQEGERMVSRRPDG
jgi:hypothetical protein